MVNWHFLRFVLLKNCMDAKTRVPWFSGLLGTDNSCFISSDISLKDHLIILSLLIFLCRRWVTRQSYVIEPLLTWHDKFFLALSTLERSQSRSALFEIATQRLGVGLRVHACALAVLHPVQDASLVLLPCASIEPPSGEGRPILAHPFPECGRLFRLGSQKFVPARRLRAYGQGITWRRFPRFCDSRVRLHPCLIYSAVSVDSGCS